MIDLHCRCGAVHLRDQGEVLRHVVCHCADCRVSRDWLAAQGGPDGMHHTGGNGTFSCSPTASGSSAAGSTWAPTAWPP